MINAYVVVQTPLKDASLLDSESHKFSTNLLNTKKKTELISLTNIIAEIVNEILASEV